MSIIKYFIQSLFIGQEGLNSPAQAIMSFNKLNELSIMWVFADWLLEVVMANVETCLHMTLLEMAKRTCRDLLKRKLKRDRQKRDRKEEKCKQ